MKLFIDSADIDEIRAAYEKKIICGVTTNPSLITKAMEKHGITDMVAYIQQIIEIMGKVDSLSLEVISTDHDNMAPEGLVLIDQFGDQIAVKVPVNPRTDDKRYLICEGLKTIRELSNSNTNATLVMTPQQAILAAIAGATYVSPFAGRIDDYLREEEGEEAGKDFGKSDYFPAEGIANVHDYGIVSGVHLVMRCVQYLRHYDFNTEVIAASTRNIQQLLECAKVGAHIATVPFSVLDGLTKAQIEELLKPATVKSEHCLALENMLEHTKTEDGMRIFCADVVPEYAALFKGKSGYQY
ncbi:MAG: transaldolase [Nanoarchaeota archaeon]|nr:transaldolase [Nanoarchaeota archaeon]